MALVEKEEETMGSCSNRYSDEMMMLKASVEKEVLSPPSNNYFKASVEKDRHERSRHRSSSTVSSRSVLKGLSATNLFKVWEYPKITEQVKE